MLIEHLETQYLLKGLNKQVLATSFIVAGLRSYEGRGFTPFFCFLPYFLCIHQRVSCLFKLNSIYAKPTLERNHYHYHSKFDYLAFALQDGLPHVDINANDSHRNIIHLDKILTIEQVSDAFYDSIL